MGAHRANDAVELGIGVACQRRFWIDPDRDRHRDQDITERLLDRARLAQGTTRTLDDIDHRAARVDEGDRLKIREIDPFPETARIGDQTPLPLGEAEGAPNAVGPGRGRLFTGDKGDPPGGFECTE